MTLKLHWNGKFCVKMLILCQYVHNTAMDSISYRKPLVVYRFNTWCHITQSAHRKQSNQVWQPRVITDMQSELKEIYPSKRNTSCAT